MIGLIGYTLDMLDVFTKIGFGVAAILACFVTCGIYRCCQCRARECCCIKRLMRATGADKFDDFEATVLVHEAIYTASTRINTKVRVTAGTHSVTTDESSKSVYQQPLAIFVAQGTEEVAVELISNNRVLAVKHLSVMKDILEPKARGNETLYQMKQKNKHTLNPKIRLTILLQTDNELENGMLQAMHVSPEAGLILRQQWHKEQEHEASMSTMPGSAAARGAAAIESGAGASESEASSPDKQPSKIQLLMKACAGPLDKFGNWGSRSQVYVAVRGPPEHKKYTFGMWATHADYEADKQPLEEVEILKIASVAPDPNKRRQEVFIVEYVDHAHARQRLTFRRLDRGRDVWVEMLQVLIQTVHATKDERHGREHHAHGHGHHHHGHGGPSQQAASKNAHGHHHARPSSAESEAMPSSAAQGPKRRQ